MKFHPYSEYKDAGLSWVGIIPAHWPEKRAKQYFKEIDISAPCTSRFTIPAN
jgi:type I restriction enzyme S subunit